uniref:Uncharacterized protein n=1 Tax=Anguilla anguilla TaxID=7936 RepID=A0A0E9SX56_ANGAN
MCTHFEILVIYKSNVCICDLQNFFHLYAHFYESCTI